MGIRAVIFDMYETLVTVFDNRPYYSAAMAMDAGVPVDIFRQYWRGYEQDRTLGKCDLSTAVYSTLNSLGITDGVLAQHMIHRSLAAQRRIFTSVRPEITGMLNDLRGFGCGIGLISNCFAEERHCIRASVFNRLFDAMMLSCEQGICKPDEEIFLRCARSLGVPPKEILYVGDGGSGELEQAMLCGMQPVQACWFIREEEADKPCGRKDGFLHAESPQEITAIVKSGLFRK